MRQLPEKEYLRLKAATRRLVRMCGGIVAAAETTRVDKGRMSRYCDAKEDLFAPIDVIADLEAEVNEPIVSSLINDMCSESRVPRQPTDPGLHLHKLTKELGDVAGAVLEAQKDGRYSINELETIHKEMEDLLRRASRAHDDVYTMIAALRGSKETEAA